MFAISTVNQWLADGDPVSAVHHMIHTSCAVAVDLSVVKLCVFLLSVHMRCCDIAPLCTAADVLLLNCC